MLQEIMEVSSSQVYPLGMRYARDDRVYRYTQADSARQLRPAYGVFGDVRYAETGVLQANALAGASIVSCTAVGTVVAGEFAGGILGVYGGGGLTVGGEQYKILTNSAEVGGVFTVTLVDPLVQALGTSDVVTLEHSPWRRVISMRQRQIDGVATDWRKVSYIGVPNRYVPLNNYCWTQTWGPCIMVGSAANEGVADSERCMQFADDGAICRLRDLGDGLGRHQIAGFIIPVTTAGQMPFFSINLFLQIAP